MYYLHICKYSVNIFLYISVYYVFCSSGAQRGYATLMNLGMLETESSIFRIFVFLSGNCRHSVIQYLPWSVLHPVTEKSNGPHQNTTFSDFISELRCASAPSP